MRPFQLPVALTAAAVLLGAALPLRADDTTVNYAYPTEQPGFFHRVGDFFRDLFATEQSLGPAPTPPRPTAPRYNLDLPAPGTGYGYGRVTPHQAPDVTEQNTVDMYPTKPKPAKKTTATVSATTSKKTTTDNSSTPPPASKPKKPAPLIAEGDGDSASPPVRTETRTTTTSKGTSESKSVPVGTHTSKATRVKSPFPPYNELDISGLQSGSLAMDPTTNRVFRVP